MAKSKHMGHGKMGKQASQGGGNLKLPKSSSTVHVAPMKDTMAANVGGNAHMSPSKGAMGHQEVKESGSGRAKKSKY